MGTSTQCSAAQTEKLKYPYVPIESMCIMEYSQMAHFSDPRIPEEYKNTFMILLSKQFDKTRSIMNSSNDGGQPILKSLSRQLRLPYFVLENQK